MRLRFFKILKFLVREMFFKKFLEQRKEKREETAKKLREDFKREVQNNFSYLKRPNTPNWSINQHTYSAFKYYSNPNYKESGVWSWIL